MSGSFELIPQAFCCVNTMFLVQASSIKFPYDEQHARWKVCREQALQFVSFHVYPMGIEIFFYFSSTKIHLVPKKSGYTLSDALWNIILSREDNPTAGVSVAERKL